MKTKTIIKFFSELFNKNFSHAEKSAGRSNETVQEENRKDRWETQTDSVIKKLTSKVTANDYEGVFEMLENSADPNTIFYRTEGYSYDNGLITGTEKVPYRLLDIVSDKAMIKLLRSYGAKTSEEIAKEHQKKAEEEREKKEQERKRKEQEHETRSNVLVDSLLNKRQLPVRG